MSLDNSNKIGVLTATIVGMNAMIGAGIFVVPTILANKVGPAVVISFALVAFATWCIAQSVARVAQLYPEEGSFYIYAKPWSGHIGGIIANGAYLCGLLIAMGLLTHAAGEHFAYYFPTLSVQALGIITLSLLTLLNAIGVSLSSLGQQILIVCTVFPLLATTAMCLTKANFNNFVPFIPFGVKSIFEATRVIAFAFFGFEAAASLFTVIENPEKNVPKALTYSLIIVALLYLFFVVSLILAVPLSLFQQFPGPIAGVLSHIFPDNAWIVETIHIASISAILGTLHSMIWASGTLLVSFMQKACNQNTASSCTFLSKRNCTLMIGAAIFLAFKYITSDYFFLFTALFLILSFMLSIITLLFIKSEWKSGQNYITLAAIGTGLIIGGCAVAGLLGY